MNLTDTERLILANQFEILGKLKSDDGYIELADNLSKGHVWLYNTNPLIRPIFSMEKSSFVVSILELYEVLQDSYAQLSDKGSLVGTNIEFLGFNGNTVPDFVDFLASLLKSGQFPNIKNINSRIDRVDVYKNMLNKWEALDNKKKLSQEDIQYILS